MRTAIDAGLEDRIKAVGRPLIEIKRAVSVAGNNRTLLQTLDPAIDALLASPRYQAIYAKWYGRPRPFWTPWKIIAFMAASLAVVMMGMAVWRYLSLRRLNRSLARMVAQLQEARNALALRDRIAAILLTADGCRMYAEVLSLVLDELRSPFGYFGFIDENGDLVCPSMTHTIWEQCDIPDKTIVFPKESWGGLWGRSLMEQNVLVANDGLDPPDGHLALERALACPILHAGVLIGQMVVANKPTDYLPADRDRLTDIAAYIAPFLRARIEKDAYERRRRKVEEQLHFQSMLLDQIHDHVTATDLEGTVIYVNQAQARVLKRSREELLGLSIHQYGDDSERGPTQQAIIDATRTHGRWCGEVVNVAADGQRIIVDYRTRLVSDETGQTVGMVGVGTDITERKKLEDRLRQSQKMQAIGTLAGGIAHDFNNLLYPIIGLAELLMEDLPPGGTAHDNAREIFQAGIRGRDLVRRILDISRQSQYQRMPVRLQAIVDESIKLGRATIPADITIDQAIDQACAPVMGDPVQLHQVVINLITNAYHAVESSGGSITIRLQTVDLRADDLPGSPLAPGPHARLTVADTGCGIAPEIMDNIFEPYFTTKAQGKGTGLGLAIVYGIVKELDGDIRVTSRAGHGAVFDVYLPLVKTVGPPVVPADPSTDATCSGRILLVDDEVPIVRLEEKMLSRLGYTVSAHTRPATVLAAVAADPHAYDLVITDMTMPVMTGDELARQLLSIRGDLPIIICTGYSERMDPAKAESIGIRGLLMKPVVKADMARLIRRVLDEP